MGDDLFAAVESIRSGAIIYLASGYSHLQLILRDYPAAIVLREAMRDDALLRTHVYYRVCGLLMEEPPEGIAHRHDPALTIYLHALHATDRSLAVRAAERVVSARGAMWSRRVAYSILQDGGGE